MVGESVAGANWSKKRSAPGQRPSPFEILQTSLPPRPEGAGLRIQSLCAIPRAPGASRPPIRSIGRRKRSNVVKSRLGKTPPRLAGSARQARPTGPTMAKARNGGIRKDLSHIICFNCDQANDPSQKTNSLGDPRVQDQGRSKQSAPEQLTSELRSMDEPC